MPVSDTYRPPNLIPHQANTLEEAHLPPIPAPLANFFLFSTSDNRDAFLRSTSEHISLLPGFLSTILAQVCAYMSQVAKYRICVSKGSTPSTVLYARNACVEDSRLLPVARPACRCAVRGISSARCAGSRGKYHDQGRKDIGNWGDRVSSSRFACNGAFA